MSSLNLRDQISQSFDNSELRQLCFDLTIEYENLHGDTRIAKAQSLVEYCLRHDCLLGLGNRCKELRPSINWIDSETLSTEWKKVQQGIEIQKKLEGVFSAEQLSVTLNLLQDEEMGLLTQLIGNGAMVRGARAVGERGVLAEQVETAITGGNNHIGNIITVYRENDDRSIPDGQLHQAIAAYVRWVDKSYGRIQLRGLRDKEYDIPSPDLPDVYVSLTAQEKETGGRVRRGTGQNHTSIDISGLLSQGNRLVITGAPGSGKTTFLRHIAHLLAHALYTGDETAVFKQLNISGNLPLPIYLSLGDYYRYKQKSDAGTLIDFISYTLIKQHGIYNLPDNFFAQILSRKNTVCLLLDSLDEIPNENGRSQVVKDIIDLADNDVGQILVVSRDHAYVGRSMLSNDFHHFTVQPMHPEQVAALVKRWCVAVYPPEEVVTETRKLQDEIIALEMIRKEEGDDPLIDTPFMVTIVAIVYWNDHILPLQRVALYEKCIVALLAEQHKEDEGQGQSRSDLEKRGGESLDAKHGQLAQLAYEMMSNHKDKEAGRTATKGQVDRWLLPLFQKSFGKKAHTKLGIFLNAMCDRASILHEYGGQYEFTHLIFQEFLCAHHLVENMLPAEIIIFFQKEDRVLQSWWRETILSTIGYLAETDIKEAVLLADRMMSEFPDNSTGAAAVKFAIADLLELEVPDPLDEETQEAYDRLAIGLTKHDLTAPAALHISVERTLKKLNFRRIQRRISAGTCVPIISNRVFFPDQNELLINWAKEIKYPFPIDRHTTFAAMTQYLATVSNSDPEFAREEYFEFIKNDLWKKEYSNASSNNNSLHMLDMLREELSDLSFSDVAQRLQYPKVKTVKNILDIISVNFGCIGRL